MNKKINISLVNGLMVLLSLFLLGKISPLIKPITDVILMLISPIIIAFFIYYWLRPITRRLKKGRLKKYQGLIAGLVILAFIGLIILIIVSAGSILVKQFTDVFLLDDGLIENYKNLIQDKLSHLNIDEGIIKKIAQTLQSLVAKIGTGTLSIFSEIGNFTTQLVLIPFIVYYLLRDETLAYNNLQKLIPKSKRSQFLNVLEKIDKVLSNYILGQLMVALIIGGLMFIGYMIIGVPYSFLMASFAVITSIIPLIGAFLGILPGLLMAFTIDFMMAIKIVILSIIVQQLEGNFITPNLMSSKLSIHPLALMIVIIVGVNLIGVLGALIGIPAYLIITIIFKEIHPIKD